MLVQLKILSFLAVTSTVSSTCFDNPNVGEWVPAPSSGIPPGAVEAGNFLVRNSYVSLYICRAGGITGRLRADDQYCYYFVGRSQYYTKQYEVLTNAGETVWIPVIQKQMPCNIIQSGGSSYPYFVGRKQHSSTSLLPGNIERGLLYVGYEYEEFEVFVSVPVSISLPAMTLSSLYYTDGKYLIFKARSADTLYVDFGFNKKILFRLTIGEFENRVSAIGPIDDPFKAYEKTNKILDPVKMRGFWVRWVTNIIEFGVEGNTTPLVRFSDPRAYNINSASFKSKFRDSFWQIPYLPNVN